MGGVASYSGLPPYPQQNNAIAGVPSGTMNGNSMNGQSNSSNGMGGAPTSNLQSQSQQQQQLDAFKVFHQ